MGTLNQHTQTKFPSSYQKLQSQYQMKLKFAEQEF